MTGKQLFRVIFLVLLSFLIVYLYYLHTKGILASTILELWKSHQKMIFAGTAFVAYSLSIYYLGVKKGRNG